MKKNITKCIIIIYKNKIKKEENMKRILLTFLIIISTFLSLKPYKQIEGNKLTPYQPEGGIQPGMEKSIYDN